MKKILYIALGVLAVAGIVYVLAAPERPGKYDSFAVCLKDSGTVFYGAFWCPHCQQQEALLDASRQKLLDIGLYVECSTPDGRDSTAYCKEKDVKSYPTWEFPNGERVTGVVPLQTLAEKTSCQLPA